MPRLSNHAVDLTQDQNTYTDGKQGQHAKDVTSAYNPNTPMQPIVVHISDKNVANPVLTMSMYTERERPL